MSNNGEPTQPNNSYERVTVKEFVKMSKWAFMMVYKIHPLYTIAYLLFTVFSNIRVLANNFILAKILDYVIKLGSTDGANIKDIYPAITALVVIDLVFSTMSFLESFSRRSLFMTLGPRLEQELYRKINSLGIQSLENPEINNKIVRTDMYLHRIPDLYRDLADLISSLVSSIITIGIVIRSFPLVAPIMIILLVPKFLNDKKFRRLTWKLDFEITEPRRKANQNAGDLTNVAKLQEIFINNIYDFFDKKYMDFQNWYVKTNIDIRKRWFMGIHAFNFLSNFGVYFGLTAIFSKFLNKSFSVGDVYFHIRNLQNFQSQANQTFQIYNDIFDLAVRVKDGYELFHTEPSFPDGTVSMPLLTKGPDIEFKNMNFKYPKSERYILKNLNLKINSGEKIAIVGHNGAGKTTMVRLICRMYQTPEGKLLINNTDIDQLSQRSLHNNLGVLFQDYNNYTQLTPRESIFVGNSTQPLDEAKIIEAAKNAEAFNFIEELPNKFDQTLNEKYKGGVKLSTGQSQKLALARFFYRNAPLVIFDEPTASIDAESEYKIFNQIYNFFTDKTVIIISHRFSTVRNADRIIVLNKGAIAEQGSHEELMELNGLYAKSFLLQAEGYKSEKVETIV